MLTKTKLLSAGAALLLSAGAALAVPATAQSDLNVRSGPGTQYPVVGALQSGEGLDVGTCTGSWCQVSFSGGSGFANRSYLAMSGGGGPAVAVTPYVYDDQYAYDNGAYDDGAYYGYGPGVGFYAGSRVHRHGWNGQPGWSGGHAWNGGRPGGINAGNVRQGFAGPPASWQRPGTGIGGASPRGGMIGAPTGMRIGGGARMGGGAVGGARMGGGAAGGARMGGGAAAQGGFAGSIVKH